MRVLFNIYFKSISAKVTWQIQTKLLSLFFSSYIFSMIAYQKAIDFFGLFFILHRERRKQFQISLQ